MILLKRRKKVKIKIKIKIKPINNLFCFSFDLVANLSIEVDRLRKLTTTV